MFLDHARVCTALLRHLLLGPQWRWYAIGWAAAGFGVITKGVGFLPLLVLLPFALARGRRGGQPRLAVRPCWPWLLGPLAFIACRERLARADADRFAQSDPALAAYRDDILFRQTIDRYAKAWHHREPFWYFLVNVIPLPLAAADGLAPVADSHWRDALRGRDLRIAAAAVWIVLVVLFFSLSRASEACMSCLRCQLSRSPAHRSPSSFYAERAFSERYI